ncbi:MAG: tRNA pseudouridine(13) synthase TruD [Bacteroidetes bacterium]|nr:tRNA pseudouridine(13) synthase TruD [Bacteroidota bacterium]
MFEASAQNQNILNFPYGHPCLTGSIKQKPEDFVVVENLGFEPSGSGEHLFLFIEKKGITTHQLIEYLAQKLGVHTRHLGYSGLKDKHAVTSQWISVQLPGCMQIPEISTTDSIRVIKSDWNSKKLRTGIHKSNSFNITIRNVTGDDTHIESTITQIKSHGFANYFGEQRFGRQQDNVQQAIRSLSNNQKRKRLSRNKKSLYLSALRSDLFNQILSERIGQGIWQRPVDGDVYMLAGTQSVFYEPLDEALMKRYLQHDINSSISLYGTGDSKLKDQALLLEEQIIQQNTDIGEILVTLNINRSLRSNRSYVNALVMDYDKKEKSINLQVVLNKGCYLTSLLNHFILVSNDS